MRLLLAALALAGLLMSSPVLAGDREVAAVERLLGAEPFDKTMFTSQFLQAVSPEQLATVVGRIRDEIGPVTSVTHDSGNSYTVETATNEMSVDIVLDGNGKVAGLMFRPATPKNASLDDLLAAVSSQAPETAYLLTRNGEPLKSSDPDRALAVGSGFKLGILKALTDEISQGQRKWSDVVTLSDADISLPSGMLQAWPVGSPLTLHTLTSLMISISDNTATDTLLHLVGRDKVEAALGIAPVLTTRELFILKGDDALRERYLAGDEAAKRDVLAEADKQPLPDVTKALTPHTPGVEYDLSPSRLCALIESVADLDVFTINPGVARPSDWQAVAYKGGSETGVLSMTTRVVAKDGTTYCFSAIWNGPDEIDATKTQAAYAGVLAALAKN